MIIDNLLNTKKYFGLAEIVDGLEGITEFMPIEVFRCVSSQSYRNTKMDKDEQRNFLKTLGDRTDALKSYHRYCIALLRRVYPDEYPESSSF